jgi:hypothetical protein
MHKLPQYDPKTSEEMRAFYQSAGLSEQVIERALALRFHPPAPSPEAEASRRRNGRPPRTAPAG